MIYDDGEYLILGGWGVTYLGTNHGCKVSSQGRHDTINLGNGQGPAERIRPHQAHTAMA